jgi:hypothetical protein
MLFLVISVFVAQQNRVNAVAKAERGLRRAGEASPSLTRGWVREDSTGTSPATLERR